MAKWFGEFTIPLTLFELQGKHANHVPRINNIKKGLFSGSLFSRDKCGLITEWSNVKGGVWFDPEIINAHGVMCFMACVT